MAETEKPGPLESVGHRARPPGPIGGDHDLAAAVREFVAAILHDPSRANGSSAAAPSPLPTDIAYPWEMTDIEARYRILVEQIPAVIFIVFLDGGSSEAYVSPRIEQMLGFTQDESLHDPARWRRRIPPEDRVRLKAEAAQTLLTGKPLKSVYRVLARDGRAVWFHCEAKLVRNRYGAPWFVHAVGFDVTELKETEETLRRRSAERDRRQALELQSQIAKMEQSESRLAAIVESSEDAILSKSLDGVITSWNAAAARLFEYQPDEILGKSILLLVPPELHDEEMSILDSLRANRRVTHLETQRLTKSGARIDVAMTVSPVRDASGRVIGGSTIARDISERKLTELKLRVTEKLAATGRLAATISHEINNPLEAVTNLIYLAKSEPSLPPKTWSLLENADRELQRVVHIARQTLGFYRDTSVPAKIDIAELARDIMEIYRGKLANKNLRAVTRFGPCCELYGLPGEIRQVFSNLLSNAIDASPNGASIILKATRSCNWKTDSCGIRVSIGDRGAGIPQSVRPRIFEPFYSTKQNLGTGLGLWVSKSLVEKQGGSIRFRSCLSLERSGTVFSVFLPCERLDRAEDGKQIRAEAA